jgi:hypothetical protein
MVPLLVLVLVLVMWGLNLNAHLPLSLLLCRLLCRLCGLHHRYLHDGARVRPGVGARASPRQQPLV